jgi:hypothetical protein
MTYLQLNNESQTEAIKNIARVFNVPFELFRDAYVKQFSTFSSSSNIFNEDGSLIHEKH